MTEVWLKAQRDGIMEPFQSVIMGFWHTDVHPDQVGINMTHMIDVDSTKAEDLTRATIEGRRQAHHLTQVFRKVVPGMEKCYLISTAPSLGLRESRRIQGEVTLTGQDLMSQRNGPIRSAMAAFTSISTTRPARAWAARPGAHPRAFYYQIPYRALVPQKVDNLLVAGRCLSADHVALGSLRIMATCTVMGEASGAAAVLSLHDEVSPRQLDTTRLSRQLSAQGVILDDSAVRARCEAARGQRPAECDSGTNRRVNLQG